MEKLPNEILEVIFDNIDEADKKPVREVCSKWYDMNEMGKMVIKYKNDDQERIIQDICKIKPKELVFSYCHDIPGRFSIKEILDAIFEKGIVLNVLIIEYCYLEKYDTKYRSIYDRLSFNNLGMLKITESFAAIEFIECHSLQILEIVGCGLKELDLDCPHLFILNLGDNNLKEFTYCSNELATLNLACNDLRELNLICPNLDTVDLNYNKCLRNLDDLGESDCVEHLDIIGCHELVSEIDFNDFPDLKSLNISECTLNALDISALTKLENLHASFGELTEIDLTKNVNLVELWLSENNLATLDLSNNKKLKKLNVKNNPNLVVDVSHLSLVEYHK